MLLQSNPMASCFFFSRQNAKSRACSLVGGRPPTDREQVAAVAHSRTLSEGRLTRKIGSAPRDFLHFFAFLCIGQTDFRKSCHCINLECSTMPGSAAIGFNSKCFMSLGDRVNLKCPHFNLRHQQKLKGGFWLDGEGACLVCMRPI